jgi:hypothetical protein
VFDAQSWDKSTVERVMPGVTASILHLKERSVGKVRKPRADRRSEAMWDLDLS